MSLGNRIESPEPQEVHEINVTPFIDVMLVLLIVFMIAAPLATVDMPVELPDSAATAHQPGEEPVYLTLDRNLSLALGEESIARPDLPVALNRATNGNLETLVYVRADEKVAYGDLMNLLNELADNGYRQVGLMGNQRRTEATLP